MFSCEFCEISKNTFLGTPLDGCFYDHLDLYRHLFCNSKYLVCGSEAYLEACQISTMKLFVEIVEGQKLLTVCAKKLQVLRHATLLKRDFNTVGFK